MAIEVKGEMAFVGLPKPVMNGKELGPEEAVIRRALQHGHCSFWSPDRGQWLLGPIGFGPQRQREIETSLPLTDVDGTILPLGRAWIEMFPRASLKNAEDIYESVCYKEQKTRRRRRRDEGVPA